MWNKDSSILKMVIMKKPLNVIEKQRNKVMLKDKTNLEECICMVLELKWIMQQHLNGLGNQQRKVLQKGSVMSDLCTIMV